MHLIGIDCRFAASQSGIGRYTRELVSELLRQSAPLRYTLFVQSDREAWIPREASSLHAVRTAPFPHYSLAEHRGLPGMLKESAVDLLFSPHFNVPWFCPVPFVATVHDLILHRFANHASILKQAAYRALLSRTLGQAKHIITVSGFSASELMNVFGAKYRRKVSVVHEGVSSLFARRSPLRQAEVLEKHGLPLPFYLYVGNAKQHKNVQTLIDAFAALNQTERELVLVTGGPEAGKLRLAPQVRILRDVPEEDLPALYSAALCFVSASLYEGFGLPLLESAACGCPAVVTDGSAFAEIAPAGTVLVRPTVDAFRAAMASPPARLREIPALPTWEDAAAKTSEIFLRVLAEL
jgi:glycosyltransferase involved in cell wall biosynthesis